MGWKFILLVSGLIAICHASIFEVHHQSLKKGEPSLTNKPTPTPDPKQGMSVLFNPSRLEYPYGVGIFDDIHNFLPEILYDASMFVGNPLVVLVRSRVQTLFPQEYARSQTTFRLFRGNRHEQPEQPRPATPEEDREDDSFLTSFLELFGSLASPLAAAATVTAATAPSSVQSTIPSTPPPIRRRIIRRGGGLYTPPAPPPPPSFMEPVPVRPTVAELARATIVSSIDPPTEELCTICQSHTYGNAQSPQWRIIRHCGHRFHMACIDQWFESHVRCPNCQHDVREHSASERDTHRDDE